MKPETIEAIYEDGGFRPLAPADLKLAQGQKVRLVVEPIGEPDEVLALATQVYEGLSAAEIDAIDEHARRREDFFGNGTQQ
ncbi:MAG: antitoxin family protein [Phycisphaerales bacterium]